MAFVSPASWRCVAKEKQKLRLGVNRHLIAYAIEKEEY
jgi:hypothetical protein